MFTQLSLVRAVVAVLALSAGLSARPAHAQPPANSPWLFLSTSPEAEKDADPAASPATIWESGRHRVLLRPNVEQALYLYVRNPTERDQTLTVVLAAGPDDADDFARVTDVRVGARQTVRIRSPRPAPVVSVPPAAGTKPPPPPTTPLAQNLHLRLLAGADRLQQVGFAVRIQEPSQYVTPEALFEDRPGAPRRLVVTLFGSREGKSFTGPPADVNLELSPARVPDLILASIRGSTLLGKLPPGGQAKLVVVDPRFRGPNRSGIVAVGVDGYKRAFLFETDFGGTAPQPVNTTLLNLDVGPRYYIPGKPCLIALEVDKPPVEDVVVEFGIDRANTGEFVTSRYVGDRFRRAEARWDAVGNGLVFVTQVRDWVEDLDTAGLSGSRNVRLQLLDKDGKILTKDGRPGGEPIPPVLSTIVLDDTRPEGIRLAPVSKAIRNRLLTVSAVGTDPESGIARVLFFLGEPPAADGKPAPGGRVVEGVPPATPDGPFTAELQMPDRTGRIPIGVRFINNVGLFQDVVDEVEVTDPPPKPTTGTIKVTVGQGSPVRPQSGLEVQLRDEKNAMILKTGKTNEKGEYTFEDVAPGKYVVYSSKPADFSKAQSPVTVEAGKTETVTLTIAR